MANHSKEDRDQAAIRDTQRRLRDRQSFLEAEMDERRAQQERKDAAARERVEKAEAERMERLRKAAE